MAALLYFLFAEILFFSALSVGVFYYFFFFFFAEKLEIFVLHNIISARLLSQPTRLPINILTLVDLHIESTLAFDVYPPYELCLLFNPQLSSVIIECDVLLVCLPFNILIALTNVCLFLV